MSFGTIFLNAVEAHSMYVTDSKWVNSLLNLTNKSGCFSHGGLHQLMLTVYFFFVMSLNRGSNYTLSAFLLVKLCILLPLFLL